MKLHFPKPALSWKPIMHRLHHTCHLSYLGAVFLEGHGVYAIIAGCLFVVTLILLMAHEIGEP